MGNKISKVCDKKMEIQEAEDNKKKNLNPSIKTWLPDDALEILIKSGINEDLFKKSCLNLLCIGPKEMKSLISGTASL